MVMATKFRQHDYKERLIKLTFTWRLARDNSIIGWLNFYKMLRLCFGKAHGHQICQIRLTRSINQVQTNLKVIDDVITEKSRDFVKTFSVSVSKGCG